MDKLVTILGPTAAGKTKLAANLAYLFNGEIISADSRQVYIGMDIGTGKDYLDYFVNDIKIPFHLIDIVSTNLEYNLFNFASDFLSETNKVIANKRLPFLTGGTGLYLSAILQNYKLKQADLNSPKRTFYENLPLNELQTLYLKYDSNPHVKRDLDDRERLIKGILIGEENISSTFTIPKYNNLVIGVRVERELIRERIKTRLRVRLDNGMIDEVKSLMDSGVSPERLISFGLEYKFLTYYLTGKLNFNDMFQQLNSAIAAFAKRQMTWFRKMEREGVVIHWIEGPNVAQAKILVETFLNE